MSNGHYCMELVRRYINGIPAETDLNSFCKGVTKYIKDVYEANGVDIDRLKSHPEERLTASAIIYSVLHQQVWFIGDCQCLIDGELHDNPKPRETVLAEKRASFLNNALINNKLTINEVISGPDPGRNFILNDLIESCKWQNISFSVIDGFHIPISHVKVIKIPKDAKELVLASDGYPFLRSTLAESERALREQLVSDPLCIKTFKATKGLKVGNKSFDDRSYVRLFIKN